MNIKTTGILLAVLAVLTGAYFLWGVREEALEKEREEAKRVFDFEPGAVAQLVIEQDGARPVAGERTDDGWTINRPEGVPPNSMVWDRVADALSALKNQKTVEDAPDDLHAFGLEPPLLTVHATLSDGTERRVVAGSQDPFQQNRYARVDDGPVILIKEDAFFELNRSLLWLRDRDLVKAGEEGIRRVEFARYAQDDAEGVERGTPSKVVAAERGPDGKWLLTEPIEGMADQNMLNALADTIRFAKGRGYIDNPEDLEDYGLEVPGARLTVYPLGGEAQTFYLGDVPRVDSDTSEVFVRQEGRDSVFLVDAQIVALLPRTPEAFLEKRLLTMPGSKAETIELAWGGMDVRIELDERRRWQIVQPIQERADSATVSNLISDVLSIVGNGFFLGQHDVFGFSDPAWSLRLTFADEEPAVIVIGNVTSEGRYFAQQASGGVTTVSKEDVDPLMVDLFALRYKRFFDFMPEQAAEVELGFRGETYAFALREGRWTVRQPENKIWESQTDMEALLSAIAEVEFTAIEADTAPKDLAPYGLDEPVLTFSAKVIEVGRETELADTGVLRVGSPAEDNSQERFATHSTSEELFRVPQALIDQASEALRGLADR
jgi:hypothetical protein